MQYDPKKAEELRVRYLTEAVVTASPASRLVMLYDALVMDLARADRAFAENGEIKLISDLLIHAQEIILALRNTLDTSAWEGGPRLAALYDHLHTELVLANVHKDREKAATVARYVNQLASAWRQAAESIQEPVPT